MAYKPHDYGISPNTLAKKVIKGWIPYRTCKLWSKYIKKIIHNALNQKGITNIIFNGPPSHSKTHFSGKALPLWLLNTFPKSHGLFATHTERQSMKSTVFCRNTIRENPDVFNVKLAPGQEQKIEFHTSQEGMYRAAGVDGAIQGDHYDWTICDDLYKGRKQAMSLTYEETLWNWYSDTLRGRLNPNAVMIWTMTRWRDDDILGRLIEKSKKNPNADQFIVINLPAEAEEDPDFDFYKREKTGSIIQVKKGQLPPEGGNWERVCDLLGRKEGEALLPERYDEKALKVIKNSVTRQTWRSLYQGRPEKDYGKMFKESWDRKIFLSHDSKFWIWFETCEDEYGQADLRMRQLDTSFSRWFQFCDSALKKTDKADYTAIATTIINPDNQLILFDMYREQIPGIEVYNAAMKERAKYPQVIGTYIEDKGSGTIAIQIGKDRGLPLHPLKAEENKEIRAGFLQLQYEQGNVFHYCGKILNNGEFEYPDDTMPEWLGTYLDEKKIFPPPAGHHDDQVDTMAHFTKAIAEERAGIQDHGLLKEEFTLAQLNPGASKPKVENVFGVSTGGFDAIKGNQDRINLADFEKKHFGQGYRGF